MRYFLILCLAIFSSSVLASGGGGGGSTYSKPARVVDQAYEAGKNIYNGRNEAYESVKFCINDAESEEQVKASRRSLKAHKGSKTVDFAANLYNCNAPGQPLIEQMAAHDLNTVLYYLNKRYKLKLEN